MQFLRIIKVFFVPIYIFLQYLLSFFFLSKIPLKNYLSYLSIYLSFAVTGKTVTGKTHRREDYLFFCFPSDL